VPTQAAIAFAPRPYERGIITSITANAPTTATASGEEPSRIAGTTNSTTTTRLAKSPISARRPCIRPVSKRRTTKPTASQSIALRRSKSAKEYGSTCTDDSAPGGTVFL
jgi:hypothetical protein